MTSRDCTGRPRQAVPGAPAAAEDIYDLPMGPDRSPQSSRIHRWGAINTLSPVKGGHLLRLRLVLWFGERVGGYSSALGHRRLVKMRVIALARWSVLAGSGWPRYLLFETNWSGADASYIPDFAMVMPNQWNAIWGNTKNFPGPLPATKLLEHVQDIDWGTDHFWSDYRSDASTQDVVRALELRGKLEHFIEQTRGVSPDRFTTCWRRFVTDVQGLL